MSKIIQAVNAMISNPSAITKVIKKADDIYFLYKGKYKWSITIQNDDSMLWYYPGTESIEQLASTDDWEWENVPMVTYRTSEIGTREARASFAELYVVLKERLYKVNEVLDDIINDEDLPF